ncbi:hypothetical protein AB0F24_02070 [Streptomyces platensis]|uniref:hypothetical protein n=1 Tax=Streptomyces platensis TaxID=58346 RepID=UPI00340F27AD
MTNEAPACPECSQLMKSGGFVLSKRVDDGRRTCRSLWKCAGRHVTDLKITIRPTMHVSHSPGHPITFD